MFIQFAGYRVNQYFRKYIMIKYDDIRFDYDGKVPYHVQLETIEWRNKRNKILSRDKNTCQHCQSKCADFKEFGRYYNVEDVNMKKIFQLPFTTDFIEIEDTELKIIKALNPIYAHIHHKYYVADSLAWEYPDDALVLLCHLCHLNFHRDNRVPYYSNKNLKDELDLTPCSRCYGAGHFPEYKHIENGICFRCNGARYDELIMN